MDENSLKTTANTVRLWSSTKPEIKKDTNKYKSNSFGFYAIRGNSVIDFPEHSKKENVMQFPDKIRSCNPNGRALIIIDNLKSHHA